MLTRANDLSIYENYAAEWWIAGSPRFRSLQQITPFRLELIGEMLGPLRGKRIADLGCGGGLLAVPLLQEGAIVTGVDISPASIAAARQAAGGLGEFHCSDLRTAALEPGSFDAVLLADVVDHIPDYEVVLQKAADALRPGGRLFVCTINRGVWSKIFAIWLGEGLRLIPRGTHDWNLFVTPAELRSKAEAAGLRSISFQGEWPRILATIKNRAIVLRKSANLAVAYSALFQKH